MTNPEHFEIIAKLKMLKSHKVFHSLWTPDQITLNEVCPQWSIPEHFEIIEQLKTIEITQCFSYIFQIILGEFCVHYRIPDHLEIIERLTNVNISLDQSKKTILQKVCTLTILGPCALAWGGSRQNCWKTICFVTKPMQRGPQGCKVAKRSQRLSSKLKARRLLLGVLVLTKDI